MNVQNPVNTKKASAIKTKLEKAIVISSDDPESLFELQERIGKGLCALILLQLCFTFSSFFFALSLIFAFFFHSH